MEENPLPHFLELISSEKYPEIQNIIKDFFKKADEPVRENIYSMISNFMYFKEIAVSRKRETILAFRGDNGPKWYTRHYAVKAQDEMLERGLMKIEIGKRARRGEEKGISSIITATPKLESILRGINLKPFKVNPDTHPSVTVEKAPFNFEKIKKIGEKLKPPLSSEVLMRAFFQTEYLNKKYFSQIELGFDPEKIVPMESMSFEALREETKKGKINFMATNVFLTSMFSKEGGGRMYQRCHSFQNIKSGLRKLLTINSSPTVELDFSSMHVNSSYFICNKKNPYPDDAYYPVLENLSYLPFSEIDKAKENPEIRKAIKKLVIIGFNTPNMHSCIKAFNFNNREESRLLKESRIAPKEIYQTFVRINPGIREFFTSSSNKPHHVMFVESQIMREIMQDLDSKGILGVPLHDEIISKKEDKVKVYQTMKKSYQAITEQDINVKIE